MRLVLSVAAGRHFDAICVGRLAARVYGDAMAVEKQQVVTDWLSWLFVFDDQVDEGDVGRRPEHLASMLDIILPRSDTISAAADHPLAGALADLWRRIQPGMSQEWRHRFLQHVAEYFQACCWEATNRAADRVATPAVFPAMRRTAGAVVPSLDLIEFACDLELPIQLRVHPLYLELVIAAADVICWTDDLFTVEKEMAHGDVHNLVIVLAHHDGCTVDAASQRVNSLLTERLEAFFGAERRLCDSLDVLGISGPQQEQVEWWIRSLRTWMRGHLDWGLETPRYQERQVATTSASPGYLDDLLPVGEVK
jgi:hypothetical protein